jgi:alginate O-acetyltransferase complex protein AlgI
MLGFHFPENFDYPYLAASITEFWRRWHKTLSGWFRDYVYIPLGGNRKGRGRQILYLLLVWGLTGLWHGAALNFLLWGLLYGCLLIVEKLFLLKFLEKHPAFGHFYTLLFVVLGFVLFGASSFSELLSEFSDLFGLSGIALVSTETLYYGKSYGILLLICLLGATPLPKKMFQHLPQRAKSVVEPILLLGSLLLVTAYQVDGSFNPFLYFRF